MLAALLQYPNTSLSITAILWLFPIAFLLHDSEEIAMVERFMRKNKGRITSKLPRKMNALLETTFNVSSSQFAIAVGFLLIIIIGATYLGVQSVKSGSISIFFLAVLLATLAHVFIHVGQTIILRTYTLGVVSAIMITLPYSIYALFRLSQENLLSWHLVYISIPLGLAMLPLALLALSIGKALSPRRDK
ncbi:MAG TPA: HXXEE domain-containing protein [Candidatus Aquicultor sp.]